MKTYHIHVPGWAHAMTGYGHNKKDAVARFRTNQGFLRMPKGYAIWEQA